jgi:hypothetical protein
VKLIVQPIDGVAPILAAIKSAKKSVRGVYRTKRGEEFDGLSWIVAYRRPMRSGGIGKQCGVYRE